MAEENMTDPGNEIEGFMATQASSMNEHMEKYGEEPWNSSLGSVETLCSGVLSDSEGVLNAGKKTNCDISPHSCQAEDGTSYSFHHDADITESQTTTNTYQSDPLIQSPHCHTHTNKTMPYILKICNQM